MIKSSKKSSTSRSKIGFMPDLDDYLEAIGNGVPVSVEGLENIISVISIKSGLTFEQSKIILRLFFQEIRHVMLRGDRVYLRNLGRFFISSPATTGTSRKIFAKFEPGKSLLRKIRYK